MKRILSAFLPTLLIAVTGSAQPVMDIGLRRLLMQDSVTQSVPRRLPKVGMAGAEQGQRTPVIIQMRGGKEPEAGTFLRIGGDVYTARLTGKELSALAGNPDVSRVAMGHRHRLLTDHTREATGTNRVHQGEGLDAPFTGRGVIIAMIDEGFEYNHVSFTDAEGRSRVKYVWNRRIEGSLPTDAIPQGGDGYTGTSGHATHTTSTAAGREISGCSFYGMAPDADLILIPSDLDNAELLEDAAFVSQKAREEGKRWILNMSFGSHEGPHDGCDLYSRTMDSLVRQDGGFIVAAMGNEGGKKLHAGFEASDEGSVKRVLLRPSGQEAFIDVWAQSTDSLRHAVMRPFVVLDGAIRYDLVDFQSAFLEEINPYNRKQHANLLINSNALKWENDLLPVGIEVSDGDGTMFHAWTDVSYGEFYRLDSRFVRPDDQYLVCEGGATVPSSIAVGAYTASNTTQRINGTTVSFASAYPLGSICRFSNSGPYLGEGQKPTVAAPGAVIRAAVAKTTPEFQAGNSSLVQKVTYDGEDYYYGFLSGTSMSTPVVTGILALWLEACPTLTYEGLMEILRTCSHEETDSLHWGYGRIDAYMGLQAALQQAAVSGIDNTREADFPAVLKQTAEGWRVMSCRDCADIQWCITNIAGKTLRKGHSGSLRQGQDIFIHTTPLPQGVYILRLNINGKQRTKKFIR